MADTILDFRVVRWREKVEEPAVVPQFRRAEFFQRKIIFQPDFGINATDFWQK